MFSSFFLLRPDIYVLNAYLYILELKLQLSPSHDHKYTVMFSFVGQFNFAIGNDGTILELNGFHSMGKHAKFFDSISLGMVISITTFY